MENFTNSAGGTDLFFHVTPLRSIASVEALRWANTKSVLIAGVAGAAGLTVSAGWVQCVGGYQTTGTATGIINASSGGVTSRCVVLSAVAGTPNLPIQEGTVPAPPSSGWSRLFMDSRTHKLMASQNGAAAVGLLDRLTSINSQPGLSIPVQGYTSEIAVSTPSSNTVQIRLATKIEPQGTVHLIGGHLYLANNYSIYFRDTSGNDRVAITRGTLFLRKPPRLGTLRIPASSSILPWSRMSRPVAIQRSRPALSSGNSLRARSHKCWRA